MNKALKWILIGVGALMFLIIAGLVIFSFSGGEEKIRSQQAKSRRLMGKTIAVAIYNQMELGKIETDPYPAKEYLDAAMAEISSNSKPYTYGVATDSEEIAKLCPDCVINSTAYKIAILGNIDEDPELDVMTINNENKIMLIQDDLGESNVPVDISLGKN